MAFFDPWLTAKSPAMRRLVDDIAAVIAANEPDRLRRRKAADAARWRATVEALVCNLALLGPDAELSVTIGGDQRAARYSPPHIGQKSFRAILEAGDRVILTLAVGGARVNAAPGDWKGIPSTIAPTPEFVAEVRARGLKAADCGRRSGEEVVILSRNLPGEDWGDAKRRETVDYADNRESQRFRREVRQVNSFLTDAADAGAGEPSVAFLEDGQGHVNVGAWRLRRRFVLLPDQDAPKRGVPHQGGRLWGGFWIYLGKARRRESLRINGEPIAEVDANAMFVRLALARLGVELPDEFDPYAVPGFEGHRGALKRGLNALFFSPGLRRWPKDIAADMPNGWHIARTRAAVLARLPELGQCLAHVGGASPAGLGLMFTESEVLLDVLRRTMAAGIVALPLHDAVLVARSDAEAARGIFEDAARAIAGVRIPVRVKG